MTNSQKPVPLIEKRAYKPEGFLVHAGIKDIVQHAEKVVSSKTSGITLIDGQKLSGKTHLGIFLTALGAGFGGMTIFLSDKEAQQFLLEKSYNRLNKATSIVIDDLQILADAFPPGQSGPFVAFSEYCRNNQIHIFLLCSEDAELKCDEHIKSRLNGASRFEIGSPGEDDLVKLLSMIAKQRGLLLGRKSEMFLTRRLPRTVQGINAYLDRLSGLNRIVDGKMGLNRVKEVV